jgi:deoxycytidylate deaminase
VHAEENALLQAIAASGPQGLGWARLFSTHRPCARCIRLAAHLGVAAIEFAVDQLSDVQADEADEIERVLYFPVGSRIFWPRIERDQR